MRFFPRPTLLLVGAAASASLCLAQADESSTAKRWDVPDFYFTGISTFAHMEHVKWYVSSRLVFSPAWAQGSPCSLSSVPLRSPSSDGAMHDLSWPSVFQPDPTFSRVRYRTDRHSDRHRCIFQVSKSDIREECRIARIARHLVMLGTSLPFLCSSDQGRDSDRVRSASARRVRRPSERSTPFWASTPSSRTPRLSTVGTCPLHPLTIRWPFHKSKMPILHCSSTPLLREGKASALQASLVARNREGSSPWTARDTLASPRWVGITPLYFPSYGPCTRGTAPLR